MDNENIKEILEFDFQSQGERIEVNEYERDILKDYITNLQEKSNNQAEEINRLYKQREKFMKKYGYLKEENEKLKEIINDDMTAYLKGLEDGKDKMKECYDSIYKSRNEKAIEYNKKNIKSKTLNNILNGGDEE